MRRLLLNAGAIAVCYASLTNLSRGVDRSWEGGDGSFQDKSQWSGGSVPGENDSAIFDLNNERALVDFADDVSTAGLRVLSGDVTFEMNNELYSLLGDDENDAFIVGGSETSPASLRLVNGRMDYGDELDASFADWTVGQFGEVSLIDTSWRLGNNSVRISGQLHLNGGSIFGEFGGGGFDVSGELYLESGSVDVSVFSSSGSQSSPAVISGGGSVSAEFASISRTMLKASISTSDISQISNSTILGTFNARDDLSIGGDVIVESGTLSIGGHATGGGRLVGCGGATLTFGQEMNIGELVLSGSGTRGVGPYLEEMSATITDHAFLDGGASRYSDLAVSESGLVDIAFLDTREGNTVSVDLDGSTISVRSVDASEGGTFAFALGDAVSDEDYVGLSSRGLSNLPGDATDLLGGTLSVGLLESFTATRGDTFALIQTEGMLGGVFDQFELPSLRGNLSLTIVQTDQAVLVTIIPAPSTIFLLFSAGVWASSRQHAALVPRRRGAGCRRRSTTARGRF